MQVWCVVMHVGFHSSVGFEDRQLALASGPVPAWLGRLEAEFGGGSAEIRAVVRFGERVGFVLADAEVRSRDGCRLPGTAFLRGDSVAVLPVLLPPSGDPMAVLVRQARVPIGRADWIEIPAGMVDGERVDLRAVSELAEEVGVDLAGSFRREDLVELWKGHPSPGGSDEMLTIYAVEVQVDDGLVASLSGRVAGNPEESEATSVVVVPIDELPHVAGGDMKSILAWHAYRALLWERGYR